MFNQWGLAFFWDAKHKKYLKQKCCKIKHFEIFLQSTTYPTCRRGCRSWGYRSSRVILLEFLHDFTFIVKENMHHNVFMSFLPTTLGPYLIFVIFSTPKRVNRAKENFAKNCVNRHKTDFTTKNRVTCRFLHICHVEKCEIHSNMAKFHISPHLLCGKI